GARGGYVAAVLLLPGHAPHAEPDDGAAAQHRRGRGGRGGAPLLSPPPLRPRPGPRRPWGGLWGAGRAPRGGWRRRVPCVRGGGGPATPADAPGQRAGSRSRLTRRSTLLSAIEKPAVARAPDRFRIPAFLVARVMHRRRIHQPDRRTPSCRRKT